MSNSFSKIAIPAAIAVTMTLSLGAALAQSQQTGNQPSATQAQPGQPTGTGAAQPTTGNNTMPMQGMEHGRMMRDQGHKMMQNETKEHGQTGNAPCGPGQTQTQNSGCK